MDINKMPTHRDLASMYLDGMTNEEIMRMYKAEAPQTLMTSRKRETKKEDK